MRKIVIVYLLIELAFIASCDFGKQDCGILSESRARVGDMSARTVKYYSYNFVETVNTNDSLSLEDLALWVDTEPYFISLIKETRGRGLYACSPSNVELEDFISDIKVTNAVVLNDTIAIGTDLSTLFAFKTIQGDERLSNLTVLNSYFQSDYYFFLSPKFEIHSDQYVQFDFLVSLDSEEEFEFTSNKVFLQ